MINTFSVCNYRSLLELTMPLGELNLVVGANGSGKSNLYRALRLLAMTGQRGIVYSLAQEGGLGSSLWAGPETITKAMRAGDVPIQGLKRKKSTRLNLGFSGDDYGYAISLGKPFIDKTRGREYPFDNEAFIRREVIWSGGVYKPHKVIAERTENVVKIKQGRNWHILSHDVPSYLSLFEAVNDPVNAPELSHLRELIRQWRFYDFFRTDMDSPARQPQLGTMTPVISHDGVDLASALMTIDFIGDADAMKQAVHRAFPETELNFEQDARGNVSIGLHQHGLLRPLTAKELSEGTIRYLFWVAVLLSPRPAPLIVLNEPETSLHPDLLPALAELIIHASQHSQVWVVSHANRLINALSAKEKCVVHTLDKPTGTTQIMGQGLLDAPAWQWPTKFK